MGIIQTVRAYLGLDQPSLHQGFTTSARGASLPVCDTCGAVVAFERQALHEQWHAVDLP